MQILVQLGDRTVFTGQGISIQIGIWEETVVDINKVNPLLYLDVFATSGLMQLYRWKRGAALLGKVFESTLP